MPKLFLSITSVGLLGFYRGTQEYKYKYNKSLQKYDEYAKKNDNDSTKPYFLYSDSIYYGVVGTFFYLCPFLFPLMLTKEIYRLEVDIRKLDHLKDDKYYCL
jgi:hypothetical protein